jgi:hypothetical protein
MPYAVKCIKGCADISWPGNIVELLKIRDQSGFFKCACGKSRGYVEKSFALQEKGEVWEPYLRGAVALGEQDDTYQPFVYLVSYSPDGPIDNFWFAYYKDTRESGGRLKLGHGPGGPPVLGTEQLLSLLKELMIVGAINRSHIQKLFQ